MTPSLFPKLAAACLLLTTVHAATVVTYFDVSGTGSPFSSSYFPGMPEMTFPGPPITIPGPPITTPGPMIPGPDGSMIPGPPITMPGPPITMPGPPIVIPAVPSSANLQGLAGVVFAQTADGVSFSQGSDLAYHGSTATVTFVMSGNPRSGAAFSPGPAFNLVGVSLDGDEVFESVAQFSLNAEGTAQLLAIVTNDDNTPLSISQGYAMLVPEPSACALSAFALVTLMVRRRR